MWFKNLISYAFSKPVSWTDSKLESALANKPFRGCNSQDASAWGWVSPLGRNGTLLTHSCGDFVMFCFRKEEKILPASVVKDALTEQLEEIEQREHRTVSGKEKKALREDIEMTLLPRAFSRYQHTFAFVDKKEGWIHIDASSFKKAEELTSCLRENLGSLPIVTPALKKPLAHTMTGWLVDKPVLPTPFQLGEECSLRDPGEGGGQISVKNQILQSEEIQAHIAGGLLINKLSLEWNEAQTFVLSEDFTIKKLKFTELVQSQLDEINAEDKASQFDADFSIMSESIRTLNSDLIEILGGLSQQADKTS